MPRLDYLKDDLKAWAAKPYDLDADLFNWFLSIGALTFAVALWTILIRRILKGLG